MTAERAPNQELTDDEELRFDHLTDVVGMTFEAAWAEIYETRERQTHKIATGAIETVVSIDSARKPQPSKAQQRRQRYQARQWKESQYDEEWTGPIDVKPVGAGEKPLKIKPAPTGENTSSSQIDIPSTEDSGDFMLDIFDEPEAS